MTNLEKFLYNLIKQNQVNNEGQFIVGQIFEAITYPQYKHDDQALCNYVKAVANLIDTKEGKYRIAILKPHLMFAYPEEEERFGSYPKITCIKIIKKVFNLGLKEAKEESEKESNLFTKETFHTIEEATRWIDELIKLMRKESSDTNNNFLENFFEIV